MTKVAQVKWTFPVDVYLTEKDKFIKRAIWANKSWGDDKRFFVKDNGNLIEVKQTSLNRWVSI